MNERASSQPIDDEHRQQGVSPQVAHVGETSETDHPRQPELEVETTREAIEQDADNPELRFQHGLALHESGHSEQATTAFEECLARLDPEQMEAVKRMGTTLFKLERFDLAERFLQLIADKAADPEIYECMLAIAQSRSRPQESQSILKKLIELRPDESKYLVWQIGIQLDQGQPAEALRAFHCLPDAERQQLDNQFRLGVIYFHLKRFQQAHEVLQHVVTADPENADAKKMLEHCEAQAAEQSDVAAPPASMLRDTASESTRSSKPRQSVIRLRDVGLRYGRIRGVSTREPAWSLRNLDLEIYEGETLGIVGRNGAGKTTLMRVLADLIKPDEGRIEASCGRRMMLSISMGFVPTISGRKNIMLYGLLLGESLKTMRSRLERIIAFSELAEAIDDPVCTYSLGMRARLGFAIAFSAEPDVLLMDEVLGVGDQAFGRKSYEALRRRLEANKTAVLTTHNDVFIRNLCDRAVWLDDGRIKMVGPPGEVVDQYQSSQGT